MLSKLRVVTILVKIYFFALNKLNCRYTLIIKQNKALFEKLYLFLILEQNNNTNFDNTNSARHTKVGIYYII